VRTSPNEFKWITQLRGSSATSMNVLHGREFETNLCILDCIHFVSYALL
jgi:hypothetical protein